MTWFKVDDGLHAHKKAARAGVAAMGLWVLAGSWCADQLTDGFLPDYIAARIDPQYEEHAARLVAAGLFDPAEDADGDKGWQFHDWADEGRQPTAESVKAKQQEARDRMARLRAERKANQARTNPAVRANEQRTPDMGGDVLVPSQDVRANNTGTFADGSQDVRSARPDPPRPDPTVVPKGTTEDQSQNPLSRASRSTETETAEPAPIPGTDVVLAEGLKPAPKAKRGSRLPADWTPPLAVRDWAVRELPGFDTRREHANFVDYWIAAPGQKGVKVDWDATWRRWMRNAAERSGWRPPNAVPTRGPDAKIMRHNDLASRLREEGL